MLLFVTLCTYIAVSFSRTTVDVHRGANYCDERVRLSVYDIIKTTSERHKIFCALALWLWLGPRLTTVPYVIYFRFVDDVIVVHCQHAIKDVLLLSYNSGDED